ncbi:3-hydroxybutyrate oligomer hydrolase family protein [Paraburkholderia dipogonis]|uniref:3-hydroxybutyrate oligomer hydrolase family protein n=1 Tax=Paraburkholderia dipogonis TaxID=1211383 RepID=UPI0035E75874
MASPRSSCRGPARDALVPINHASRPYLGLNQLSEGGASKLSFYEVTKRPACSMRSSAWRASIRASCRCITTISKRSI